jgi:hypothetical protein
MIAFPCSTFSVSRFFDATVDGHDSGPPIVRDHDHPDGIPDLDPKHVKGHLRGSPSFMLLRPL